MNNETYLSCVLRASTIFLMLGIIALNAAEIASHHQGRVYGCIIIVAACLGAGFLTVNVIEILIKNISLTVKSQISEESSSPIQPVEESKS